MWVRGLKPAKVQAQDMLKSVAPYVGAWIETVSSVSSVSVSLSHPMWVRGLKLLLYLSSVSLLYVAPYVGAWIETLSV